MFPFTSNKGILGLNARNLLYIKPFNPRKAVAFADDKLKTKAFLAARGVPVAKIYARIETREQLADFDFSSLPDECVLKPNYGFGGEGIIILRGRKNGQFLVQGKKVITDEQMKEHIEDILDGKFSVNGKEDTAFFEKILVADECFAPFRPAGLPDIRIVVFNLVPVMAMLRVPTAESGGKANVHLGGIGIGIDIAKGITTHATQYNRIVKELPHGMSPAGIEIPGWDEMLLIASKIQYITNIGYLAVDLTIDAEQGPALLEVNARAGLMVQVANLAPLRARLERVEGLKVPTPEKGVLLAQELFGQKVRSKRGQEEEEKPVLGLRDLITISGDTETMEVPVTIAAGEERTIFADDLLKELSRKDMIEPEDESEQTFRIKFTLGGRKIQTVVRRGEVPHGEARAIIGRRDLVGFLIDPGKMPEHKHIRPAVKEHSLAIDKVLSQIDESLLILKHIKPINLAEERQRCLEDTRYNPVFQYANIQEELQEAETRLMDLSPDDSPLGQLLRKKRRELLLRVNLLRCRGSSQHFTDASATLFGTPSAALVTHATSFLKSQIACDLPPREKELLSAEEAAEAFDKALQKYGLHDWQVNVRESLVADCTVGGHSVYVRAGAKFSKMHIDSLIAHEIETHIFTAENGEHQPYDLFRRGFGNYLDTQEGLAVLNQNRVLSPHHDKRYGPARNVLAIVFALNHSFAETRAYLEEDLGYREEKALSKAIDLKRGMTQTSEPGAFTKGIVYFRGMRALEQFIADGGDLRRLYIGKIALEDLELIEQIPEVRPAILLPMYLREKEKEKATGVKKKKK